MATVSLKGMATVTVNGTAYTVTPGTGLKDLLVRKQLIGMPCGGHGRCGKCRVMASGELSSPSDTEFKHISQADLDRGIRLACCATVEGDCTVQLLEDTPGQIRTSGDMPDIPILPTFSAYGVAVDIGTTTLAACLYDTKGALLSEVSRLNPQAGWGADVISRIEAAMGGADKAIAAVTCQALDGMLLELAAKAGIPSGGIDGLVITGNTVMLHLLTCTPTEPLSHAPFLAQRLFGETVSAGSLGLSCLLPDTGVYLAPCVSAFVGADLVTSLLAGRLCDTAKTQMLVDIGTNGEMALWHEQTLYVCSTAAGPAFEGAGISMGMAGKVGAIDHVSVQNGELTTHVIGHTEPCGLCGSGVIDAVACLLETGQLDETGSLEDEPAVISPPVTLTQQDVRMVQLAKSAIHAGIRTLLHSAGLDFGDVSALLIAGGFGSYLDVNNAGRIGLLPADMVPCVRIIGNAALSGAAMLLLNRDCHRICRQYAQDARVIDLSGNPFFADAYMEGMLF